MPNPGDIFKGRINDLCQYDVEAWRRRDIWFHKNAINAPGHFDPAPGSEIALVDTEGNRYSPRFSKPDEITKICLGYPSKLKPWYQEKGFNYSEVTPDEKIVFFEYTGRANEFLIFTEGEYNARIEGHEE